MGLDEEVVSKLNCDGWVGFGQVVMKAQSIVNGKEFEQEKIRLASD